MLRNCHLYFERHAYMGKYLSYLFSLLRGYPQDLGAVLAQYNGCHTSKHLLEVFLQSWDVLTVSNNLQQVFITNKVEPETNMLHALNNEISHECDVMYSRKFIFHWTKILPSPGTFVLQKYMYSVKQNFAAVVQVTICSMHSLT